MQILTDKLQSLFHDQSLELLMKKKKDISGRVGGMSPEKILKSRLKSEQFEAIWRQIWRNLTH